jgi:hypothetical protein
MDEFYQETDFRIIYPQITYPFQSTFTFPITIVNETIGGTMLSPVRVHKHRAAVVQSALVTVLGSPNQTVRGEAERLLGVIADMVEDFRMLGFDLSGLPPMHGFVYEDGSISIDWIQTNFRVGFNIEADSAQSGWYLLSNKELGGITASGRTLNIDLRKLILWLLNFVISNS